MFQGGTLNFVAFWRVRVVALHGLSDWSHPAYWEMALLEAADWHNVSWLSAAPIGRQPTNSCAQFEQDPAPLFRTTVALQSAASVVRARAYVTGLGLFELHVNGRRIGGNELSLEPAWTAFDKRIFYSTWNVTTACVSGSNGLTIGVALGNGWWKRMPLWQVAHGSPMALPSGEPMFVLLLEIFYSDGSTQTIRSSESDGWKWRPSATLFNNIYLGEVQNGTAQHELQHWAAGSRPSGEGDWSAAVAVAKAGAATSADWITLGRLEAAVMPPVTRQDSLLPVSVRAMDGNKHLLDFGKNIAATCTFEFSNTPPNARGSSAWMRYGELLHADGTLNTYTSTVMQIKNSTEKCKCIATAGLNQTHTAWQADRYIFKGGAESEVWTPKWGWHGFRFLDIALPYGVELSSVVCHPLRTNLRIVSHFSTSEPQLLAISSQNPLPTSQPSSPASSIVSQASTTRIRGNRRAIA
eukprot:SAG11_NODE_1199_length_5539_cov_3.617647_3_plen_466_part_01